MYIGNFLSFKPSHTNRFCGTGYGTQSTTHTFITLYRSNFFYFDGTKFTASQTSFTAFTEFFIDMSYKICLGNGSRIIKL